jgi:hypothetical protein
MVANTPRGFQAMMSLHGDYEPHTHRYKVSADNAAAIFPGDPVVQNAQGGVQSWRTADASALSAQRGLLGVVKAVYDSNGKPLTHSQPTKGPFLDASTEGWVDVIIDPDVLYAVNASASASREMLGQYAPMAVGTDNSAAGISGIGIDLANVVATAAGAEVFQIIDVSPGELNQPDLIGGAAANNDVLVRISDHMYRRAIVRVGSSGMVT